MIGIKKCLSYCQSRWSMCVRSSMSSTLDGYRAVNELVYDYMKGSDERIALELKLTEMASREHIVPIVIGDREIHSEYVRRQVLPFDHKKTLAKYSWADKRLLEESISVSQEAHRAWRERPLEDRADILLQAADLACGKYRMDLMAATMLGQGKTIIQAEIDATCELADFFRFDVQYALELSKWQPLSTDMSDNKMLYRSCEGFWACIPPFNFTAISGHLVSAPVLMGNVALWKASDTAILSSYIVFKLLREAGVPAGVLNFVPCDGPLFGDVITSSSHLAGINFTGSARTFQFLWQQVSKNIYNYKDFPKLIGECGGKNFHLVHSSADVESVINGTIRSAFEYAGQKCSACSRAYVPASLWLRVRDGLVAAHGAICLGSPLDADTFLSAVIDDKSFKRLSEVLSYMRSSPSIKVIAGGNCDDSTGYFVEPTIAQVLDPNDRLMKEEFFGPLLAVYVYDDDNYESVLRLINETTHYALTGAIYANEENVLIETSEKLRFSAGNLYLNDRSTGSVVCQQPFGGARKSGTNDKAGGPYYLTRFMSPQAIKRTHQPARGWTYPYMEE